MSARYGSDQATFKFQNENDEIEVFQSNLYISSSDAVWRVLAFPIHECYPPVIHLDIHLENGQKIYFNPDNVLERVENPKNTTLLAFFKLCQDDAFTRTLMHEMPFYYTFNKTRDTFNKRKIGYAVERHPGVIKDSSIGRIYTVHPDNSKCCYLRMLHTVPGPTSFEYLRTIDREIYPTYQAACRPLRLLENDTGKKH